jgi:hypothetical protein
VEQVGVEPISFGGKILLRVIEDTAPSGGRQNVFPSNRNGRFLAIAEYSARKGENVVFF